MSELIVICGPPEQSCFGDSVLGQCDGCHAPITWRPHVPEPSKKLCWACGTKNLEAAKAAGKPIVGVTYPMQVKELVEYLSAEQANKREVKS